MLNKTDQRFVNSVIRAIKRKLKHTNAELEKERKKSSVLIEILREEIRQLRFDIGEAKNRADIAEFLLCSSFLGAKFHSLFLEKVINFLIEIVKCSNKIEILQNISDRCLDEIRKLKGSAM